MTYIADAVRREVIERANGKCEYCLLSEKVAVKRHHIDHIYAEKHGGDTSLANLCLSCTDCNQHKGTDLCSLDPLEGKIVNLYHPRQDNWAAHFHLDGATVFPITPVGRATVRLLRMNDRRRLLERQILLRLNQYP